VYLIVFLTNEIAFQTNYVLNRKTIKHNINKLKLYDV